MEQRTEIHLRRIQAQLNEREALHGSREFLGLPLACGLGDEVDAHSSGDDWDEYEH